MEEAVTAILLADPRLAQAIGDRVHWTMAPQNSARPYLILQLISDQPDQSYQGRTGFEASRLQIDAYTETELTAKAILDFAVVALERARGTFSGHTLQGAILKSRRPLPASGAAGAPPLFRRSADVIILHS